MFKMLNSYSGLSLTPNTKDMQDDLMNRTKVFDGSRSTFFGFINHFKGDSDNVNKSTFKDRLKSVF